MDSPKAEFDPNMDENRSILRQGDEGLCGYPNSVKIERDVNTGQCSGAFQSVVSKRKRADSGMPATTSPRS